MMPHSNLKETRILSAGAEFVLKWAQFLDKQWVKVPPCQMTLYDGSTCRKEQFGLADAHMVLSADAQIVVAASDWKICINEVVAFLGFSVYHDVRLTDGQMMKLRATEAIGGAVDLSISVFCPEHLNYIFFMTWTINEPGGAPETRLIINEEAFSECDKAIDILSRAKLRFTPWLPSLHENFLTQFLGLGTAD